MAGKPNETCRKRNKRIRTYYHKEVDREGRKPHIVKRELASKYRLSVSSIENIIYGRI